MKKLILFVSIFLVASLHGFVNPANAQKQANSASGQVSSAQVTLANDYNQLVGLVQSMENTLCGNTIEGGLVVNSSGAYTNCTGGAAAVYLQWAQDYPQTINYWNGIIPNLTSEGDYSDAIDACTTNYGGKTGLFPAITAQQGTLNTIQEAFTMIVGSGSGSGSAVGGSIAQANTQINNMLTTLGNLTTSIIGNGSTVNEIAQNQQSSSVALYGSDGTGKTSGSDYEFQQCYNATVDNYYCSPPSPCATQLQALLTDYTNWTNATIALFEQLLKYEPTMQGSYNASPDPDIMNTIGCYLPGACNPAITPADFQNNVNCNYVIPTLNFDISGAVTSFTNSLNAVYQLNIEYYTSSGSSGKLNQINTRLNAIMGELKLMGNGMQNINNTTQPILTALAADCKHDIKEYQQQMEIAGIIIGIIVGFAGFELGGIIGGSALEGIIQILQMVPPVNNATFGALTQILAAFEVKHYDQPTTAK